MNAIDLPSVDQALRHNYRPDHWLRMVGQLEDNKENKQSKLIVSLHPIMFSGRLACSCVVDVRDVGIYSMNGVGPAHRHLICDEGAEYLRSIVAIELQGETQ